MKENFIPEPLCGWGRKTGRFFALLSARFMHDRCPLHAGALTFATIVSIVPVLALAFSVSKGLGGGDYLRTTIESYLVQMPEKVSEFIRNLFVYVDKTNFTTLGTVGALLLFWTVISIMGSVEEAFNSIWRAPQSRTFYRKFTDYISVMLIVPLLLTASGSITALLASAKVLVFVRDWGGGTAFFLYQKALRCVGIAGVVAAFTLLYMYVPNCRVRVVPAFIGGLAGGSVWMLLQWVYITFQVGVLRYNAIYGTFATVPIFLAWLYASWIITLLGAEISNLVQHYAVVDASNAKPEPSSPLPGMAVWVCAEAARRYAAGRGPWREAEAAGRKGISLFALRRAVVMLVEAGILVETNGKNKGYLLSAPADKLGLDRIVAAVDPAAAHAPAGAEAALAARINAALDGAGEEYRRALGAVTLSSLLGEGPVRP